MVLSSQPQAQAVQADTESVFSRLGPQLQHHGSLPPTLSQVQDQPSHGQVIPLASRVDTVPIADNVVLEVWVSVESRHKANKQSYCNLKGNEVIITEPVSAVNTYEMPSPPLCTGEVRNTSPFRTKVLVANPCAREVQRTDLLVAHTGDNVLAGNSKSVPLLGVPTKSGRLTHVHFSPLGAFIDHSHAEVRLDPYV
ncbi:hypothetical protein Peur_004610 [Populus x canadensis]